MLNAQASNPILVEGLEINTVEDGYVVYQPSLDRVHYLNGTAGLLLELCNGRHSEADLPGLLARAYGLSQAPLKETHDCLQTLRELELVI